VSRLAGAKAVLEIFEEGDEIREPIAIPDNAMTALIPAARASPVSGDSLNTRSARHQDAWEESRTGYNARPSIRTFAIRRSSNVESTRSEARSGVEIRTIKAASSACDFSS
jgi:hypothetical protein